MSEVIEAVEVDVPVRQVYDQWTRFETFPRFMEGVERVEQRDDTHTFWQVSMGGQKREFEAVITEQIPDERIAWKSVDGTTHSGVVTFHRLDPSHTRVTLQMVTAPEGMVEKLGDKLGVVKSRAKGDMKRFKEFIEERGAAPEGGWRGEVRPGRGEVRGDRPEPPLGGIGGPGPV
ncbi:SRPBCC family protein [Actinorugispora endophytica]|uniref:Polyketide cyclase/dehydrase/lipid transport protein n=1 Tax=Actinorugispora endophytica TaxID=1605990 RepID=A0A4R6UHK5_9ACTN|nr:SRPBCC family protein [Actinorugispora endophytica]TDQ46351.1 polyketide cyclase/dehydrase/lipid transport protein [Actinorugispora endophytica]